MPRKTIYNEMIKNRIVEALTKGHFINEACSLAGITKQSFYKWYNLGLEGDTRYIDFAAAVDEAQAQAVTDALTDIREAGRDDWRASAWFLERRSRNWLKTEKVELGGEDSKPIEITLLWPEDRERIQKEQEKE